MSRFKDKNRPVLSARRFSFGIVASRYNFEVTQRLVQGAKRVLVRRGARRIDLHYVPGAFEIPFALKKLARTGRYQALIALGVVIRGETPHFDYVAGGAARGVMQVMLDEKVPVAFGVLTTETQRQALDRAGGRHGHKGEEAALVAIEMAGFLKR